VYDVPVLALALDKVGNELLAVVGEMGIVVAVVVEEDIVVDVVVGDGLLVVVAWNGINVVPVVTADANFGVVGALNAVIGKEGTVAATVLCTAILSLSLVVVARGEG